MVCLNPSIIWTVVLSYQGMLIISQSLNPSIIWTVVLRKTGLVLTEQQSLNPSIIWTVVLRSTRVGRWYYHVLILL